MNNGLQVVENWNSTNEFICYGRHGEMATNSREQQEATTLSLQLLQNCLMLINTVLIQRTINRQGLWARLQPEDFRALTPLFYGHINPYGLFELDLEGPSFLDAACVPYEGLSHLPSRSPIKAPSRRRTLVRTRCAREARTFTKLDMKFLGLFPENRHASLDIRRLQFRC